MTAPFWVHECAAHFWEAAGGEPESFPRDLHSPVLRAFPVTTVSLPGLDVSSIERWLERQSIVCRLGVADRRLRACLIAHAGAGALFLDAADPDDERRFSLAHELAHFLRDYMEPRRRAVEMYGASVLEIFDGQREATREERTNALLAAIPVGFHIHLMDRAIDGARSRAVSTAEDEADRLALELLAPEVDVLTDLSRVPTVKRRDSAARVLNARYGLPSVLAEGYARMLVPQHREDSPFLRALRSAR